MVVGGNRQLALRLVGRNSRGLMWPAGNAGATWNQKMTIEQDLDRHFIRAMLMALVIYEFHKDWGFGSIGVIILCLAYAIWQQHILSPK